MPVKAIHVGDVSNLAARFDAVFTCVKSYDTAWATHLVCPRLSPNGVIVSAQNGVNEDAIAPIVGFDRLIGCVITLGARLVEPGRVLRHGDPKWLAFTLGQPDGLISRRVRALGEVVRAVGPIELTTNLWGHRWSHVARNSMANPISALTGMGTGEIRRTEGIVDVMVKIAAEAVGVARALGVEVEPITGIPAETYKRAGDPRVMVEIKEKLAEVSASSPSEKQGW